MIFHHIHRSIPPKNSPIITPHFKKISLVNDISFYLHRLTGTVSVENPILVERPSTNLKRVVESEKTIKYTVFRKYNEVIIGGMGGSGIVGSIATDLYSTLSPIPIVLLRVQKLPAWANKNTLVIVNSYSGNTSEMLSLYNDAKERGCGTVCITSGGKLRKIAEENKANIIMIAGGYMPRSDMTTPLAHVLSVIDSQIGTDLHTKFINTLKKIIPYAEELESPEMNYAKELALKLSCNTPFFYTSEKTQCVASRWRAQFNENAKKVAGDGVFPEFDHNELEGWAGDICKTNLPVFIRTKADGETAKYMDACKDVIKKWGVDPLIINIPGDTHMESIMYGIILGDYVSLYVAELQKKDPSPVDAITEFKRIMKDRQKTD